MFLLYRPQVHFLYAPKLPTAPYLNSPILHLAEERVAFSLCNAGEVQLGQFVRQLLEV